MRTQQLKRWAVGATALAFVGACSTIGRQMFQQPAVQLQDVRLTGVGIAGGNLDVVLRVYNPNGYRLDATSMHYQLNVDTLPVAGGEITAANRFPGGDTTTVHIPVQFTYAGVGAAARELTQTGAVRYTVIGSLTVDTPIGSHSFPFTSSGT
ncbi:MAG: LEA type 2 family protein, partial [Gemmatimonadaceae bacterium]